MRDYNLRSHDIYGAPPARRTLSWLKITLALALIGAGVFYYRQRETTPAPESAAVPTNRTTNPDIIPLTLPPRSSSSVDQ